LHIEKTVMRNESLETVFMDAGKHENAVSAVTCAHGTHSVTIHIRKRLGIISSREVILHYLPAPVLRDLFVPFRTPTRHSAAVWRDDDVIVSGHQRKIPMRTESLCECRLRSALAIKLGGIFF